MRLIAHGCVASLTALLYILVIVPVSRVRRAVRRHRKQPPAILWGPTPVINLRYCVAADRAHGYRSDSLVYRVYDINDRSDFSIVLDRWERVPVVGRLVPYTAVLWAGVRYDIFGFFFDGGLLAETPMWRLELPLLKLAGKRIIVYPYGGDARLASVTRALDHWNAFTDVPLGEEDRSEEDVRAHLEAFDRWADVMLGNNDLVDTLPRVDGVFPYPFDTHGWDAVEAPRDSIVTIVHASNHRHYKGTRFLVAAVEALREESLPVELVIVERTPREEARRIYERADVIAADFLLGGYAYFAIEGMALGKPVIAYLRPETAIHHPEWAHAPIVNARPDELTDRLRELVLDAKLRTDLGRRGPEYVRRFHSLDAVGEQLSGIYQRLWS